MTRKNLSDLVRKEVQKPINESEPVADLSPATAANNDDLESLTTKLKDVTSEAKHREDALHSEVSRLKEEILDQKKHIVNLQAELAAMTKLKADFEEAKAVILQLTAASQVIPSRNYIYPPLPKVNAETTDIGSWLG